MKKVVDSKKKYIQPLGLKNYCGTCASEVVLDRDNTVKAICVGDNDVVQLELEYFCPTCGHRTATNVSMLKKYAKNFCNKLNLYTA